jgi:Domain of unknown function (DUF4032)/Lipopolysaccharide kinase (Kdo/WaaP) family
VRFVFSPPTEEAAGLLTLPWTEPLEEWQNPRLVEIRQRGISRHIVRFVADDGELYALKAINENLARREYRLLRELAELNVPAVHVVGIVVDRGPDLDAILVTRFLDYSTTYRAVFSSPRGGQPTDRLLDALVELLVRLHLSGFFWGDCSLSNTLFRYDAGTLEAYLVDAETSERHPTLTSGQRHYDVELAEERVYGELLDLQAGELLSPELDPLEIAAELPRRYERLWDELTREELLQPDDQRYRIAQRLRRLNELGFDADEVELISTPDGNRLKLRTKVSESGHHARKLFLRTGLVVEENQARRLLNDIASFRAAVCPPPRSSTRSSSTAGTCPRRRASTWERPPRPGPISRRCCRGCPSCSARAGRHPARPASHPDAGGPRPWAARSGGPVPRSRPPRPAGRPPCACRTARTAAAGRRPRIARSRRPC